MRFCRLSPALRTWQRQVWRLTTMFSITSYLYPRPSTAGTTVALLLATLKKIGFPGWPDPNLDSVSGFWGVNYKRGLAPAPFLFYPAVFFLPLPTRSQPKSTVFITLSSTIENRRAPAIRKSERPVGVPAARAWGMEGNAIRSWSVLPVACCAREQQYDRQGQRKPPRKSQPTPDYSYNCALRPQTGR